MALKVLGKYSGTLGLANLSDVSVLSQLRTRYSYDGYQLERASKLTFGKMPSLPNGYSSINGLTLPIAEVEDDPGTLAITANGVSLKYADGKKIDLSISKSTLRLNAEDSEFSKFQQNLKLEFK